VTGTLFQTSSRPELKKHYRVLVQRFRSPISEVAGSSQMCARAQLDWDRRAGLRHRRPGAMP
jgi:hypothetical protein